LLKEPLKIVQRMGMNMGRKEISSLIDGLVSGFLFGVIIAYLILLCSLAEPIAPDTVVTIFVGTVIAVATLVYGVHSAVAKET
jgi:hypothetical protein